MNWNGGYKNRFRSRSEAHSRKNTFHQQQSRIILVDDVGIKELEKTKQGQTSPIPNKNLLTSTSMEESKVETPMKDALQYGTPFSNIPCGSSSDSQDSGSIVLSDTNYSPYSSDEETKTHHADTNFEGNNNDASSSMICNYDASFDRKLALVPYQSSGSSSSVNVSPTTERYPSYPNPHAPFATPNMSFLTPAMQCEKTIGLPTMKLGFYKNSEQHCDSYATPLRQQATTQTAPVHNSGHSTPSVPIIQDDENLLYKTPYYCTPTQKEISGSFTPIQNNSLFNSGKQGDSSTYTPVITPDQRKKRVRFADFPSQKLSVYETPAIPLHPIKETEIFKTPKLVLQLLMEDLPDRVENSSLPVEANGGQVVATVTHNRPSPHSIQNQAQELCSPVQASSAISSGETNHPSKKPRTSDAAQAFPSLPRKQSTTRKKKTHVSSKKNFTNSKMFHAPCRCRTVIQNIKVRDVGTQTSP